MHSIFIRIAEGRDRGRKQEVEYELAQSLIDTGKAVQVDPRAPELVPNFALPLVSRPELQTGAPRPEVNLPSSAVVSEVRKRKK